jgi:hypothetical protein
MRFSFQIHFAFCALLECKIYFAVYWSAKFILQKASQREMVGNKKPLPTLQERIQVGWVGKWWATKTRYLPPTKI